MEEIQKLYDVLVRDGYYTKSLDDFIVQYQDPAYVDKVFEVVTRDGLYTKDRETFDTQFSIKKKRQRKTARITRYGFRIGAWFFGITKW